MLPKEAANAATPKEEAKLKLKQYHLCCDTMTCASCEEAVVAALKDLPNVVRVDTSKEFGTIVVTASSCNSCADCKCCKCDPCSCEVCRCCACGVDKYLNALEEIDHHATYPLKKKKAPTPFFKLSPINTKLAIAFAVACFAAGSMLRNSNKQ